MSKGKKDVVVVIGAGSIGQAIARRVGAGKHIVLADISQANTIVPQKHWKTWGLKPVSSQWIFLPEHLFWKSSNTRSKLWGNHVPN